MPTSSVYLLSTLTIPECHLSYRNEPIKITIEGVGYLMCVNYKLQGPNFHIRTSTQLRTT